MDDVKMKGILSVLDFLNNAGVVVNEVIENKPYGIVHDSAFVEINGVKGRIVWDYIIFNELTFEESETEKKLSLFTSANDEETRTKFEEYVKKYGI